MNPKEIEKEFDEINVDDSDDDESEINSDIGDNIDDIIDDDDIEEDDIEDDMEEDNTDDIVTDIPFQNNEESSSDDEKDEEDDDDENENYLQKFEAQTKKNIIADFHPEMKVHNQTEIELMSIVVRNSEGIITDKFHTTIPFITKYEKTRIIGERSRQIDAGAIPFIDVEPEIIDGYLIALEEFNQKKIPFIIKRPLPNGTCEYWKVSDLDII